MCGLACVISKKGIQLSTLKRMSDLISHRGPDGEGFVSIGTSDKLDVWGGRSTPENFFSEISPYHPKLRISDEVIQEIHFGFGHRRLAIVDPSPAGHQPMCSKDSRFWIVYNGEIYNYIELKKELEALGFSFSTETDTEVLLNAYQAWGASCLERFNGMWAFVIFDKERDEVFAARDRFGVKPLYYWFSSDGTLAFASEIKQFTALPEWQSILNHDRAYDFLVHGLIDHTEETLFEGVFQLPPGCHSIFLKKDAYKTRQGSRIQFERWYELKPGKFSGTYDQACIEFRNLFIDAVRLRLRADVPVGSCLSGGLDSSSIVRVISNLRTSGSGQVTISACSEIEKYNEKKWVDIVTQDRDIEAQYIYPKLEDVFRDLERLTWHQDEPFGSTSIFAQWLVFRRAHEVKLKVMLDGQGADEQLAGYHSFFGAYLAGLIRKRCFKVLWNEFSATRRQHGYSFTDLMKAVLLNLFPATVSNFLRKYSGYSHNAPDWVNFSKLKCRKLDPYYAAGARKGSLNHLSQAMLLSSNLQMLLHWEDRDSMAHGVEARVPFLDYRLVEFVLGLPDNYKLENGITKKILRDSLRGIVPEKILGRMDKMGFVTPEEHWMRHSSTEVWRSKLKEAFSQSQDVIDPEKFSQYFEEIVIGRRKFNFVPWRIISFGEWMRSFQVKL